MLLVELMVPSSTRASSGAKPWVGDVVLSTMFFLCGGGGELGGIFYLPTVRIAGTFVQLSEI